MTLCGKPLRAFPQSLEIASRFPHSHRLDDCYTLSEFKLRKESSRTAFPNPSGSSFDWKRLLTTKGSVGWQLLATLSARGQRLVMVMQAFLDESGTNPESPVLSVAGCYGTFDEWEHFREAWSPYSMGFHAKKSTLLFPHICTAIEASGVKGMLVTVSKEIYEAHATAHLKPVVGNAYSARALLCAMRVCSEAHDDSVSFVLEHGQPNLSFVKRMLEAFMDTGDSTIAAVASARKEEFIELHTADFVSHIASSRDVAWMQRLFDAGTLQHGHVSEESLQSTSQKVTEIFRKARRMRNETKRTR